MLYYLAYAVLPHLDPTAVVLVEEPENGLHPARIREVMRVLREISKTTQVVIATHSPLVVNELLPDEVTVLTRDPVNGTNATRLKDTPNFEERAKVYALGELWVSYADGLLEAPLFKEPEQAADPGEPVEWSESSDR
jgi:predicted ATPase